MTLVHTLEHAIYPQRCSCKTMEITNCVICERRLAPDRKHLDTCSQTCFAKLCEAQRRAP